MITDAPGERGLLLQVKGFLARGVLLCMSRVRNESEAEHGEFADKFTVHLFRARSNDDEPVAVTLMPGI